MRVFQRSAYRYDNSGNSIQRGNHFHSSRNASGSYAPRHALRARSEATFQYEWLLLRLFIRKGSAGARFQSGVALYVQTMDGQSRFLRGAPTHFGTDGSGMSHRGSAVRGGRSLLFL